MRYASGGAKARNQDVNSRDPVVIRVRAGVDEANRSGLKKAIVEGMSDVNLKNHSHVDSGAGETAQCLPDGVVSGISGTKPSCDQNVGDHG